jgi:hypothetical protein
MTTPPSKDSQFDKAYCTSGMASKGPHLLQPSSPLLSLNSAQLAEGRRDVPSWRGIAAFHEPYALHRGTLTRVAGGLVVTTG